MELFSIRIQRTFQLVSTAVDYDQLRSVRVQASFQFRVFFVAANKFIHTFMF